MLEGREDDAFFRLPRDDGGPRISALTKSARPVEGEALLPLAVRGVAFVAPLDEVRTDDLLEQVFALAGGRGTVKQEGPPAGHQEGRDTLSRESKPLRWGWHSLHENVLSNKNQHPLTRMSWQTAALFSMTNEGFSPCA